MGDAGSDETSESGFDLFDRWLAHHDEKAADAAPEDAVPETAEESATAPTADTETPASPPEPEGREEPDSTPDPGPDPGPLPVVEFDPLFDESFTAHESEEVHEEPEFRALIETASQNGPADSNDVGRSILDALAAPTATPAPEATPTQRPNEPVTPEHFEPVIIPSARNRKPESRRSRRRKPAEPATAEPLVDETAEAPLEEPIEAVAPPVVEPEPPPAEDVQGEEAPAERPPERADHVDAGREVMAAFAATRPAPAKPKKRRPPEPRRPEPRRPLVGRSGEADAVEALLAATAAANVDAPAAPPVPETAAEPVAAPAPAAARVAEPASAPVRAAESPVVGTSTNFDFPVRKGTRRLVGLLLLLSVAATAVAGVVAYDDPSTFNLGLAATLGMLTLVVWAVLAGSSTTQLSVRSGQLEIVSTDGRFVFDLSSHYTPIEVVGTPGQRGWKVLFLRRSMAPFVVDASMVDPDEFMRVLRTHRPEHN